MGPRKQTQSPGCLMCSYLRGPPTSPLKQTLTPAPQSTGQQDAQSNHLLRPGKQALPTVRMSTGHQHIHPQLMVSSLLLQSVDSPHTHTCKLLAPWAPASVSATASQASLAHYHALTLSSEAAENPR